MCTLTDPRLRLLLTRSVGRRVDAADVEDVVQSTLTEAFASEALPRSEEEVRRFVFAIARQKIADIFRKRGRERRNLEAMPPVAPHTAPSGDLLRWAEGVLPPKPEARRTLQWMLREADGETLADVAAADRVPAAVVRQRVSRLRRFLRARWAKEVAGLSALGLIVVGIALFVLRDRTAKIGPPPSPDLSVPKDQPKTAPPDILPEEGVAITSATPAVSGAAPPAHSTEFDRGAAARALRVVDVQGCADASTPAGAGHVTLTFGSDGSVTSAVVDAGLLVGRHEAACIEQRFRSVHIPAFVGTPVTVGKAFRVAPGTGASSSPARPPFDAAAADAALRGVDLRRCFPNASVGEGIMFVTFTDGGIVSVARGVWTNKGMFPSEERCMSGLLGLVRVPAFSAPSTVVQVRAPFRVQGSTVTWGHAFVQAPAAPARPHDDAGLPSSVGCNPPYQFDAKGVKHYKPECVQP